MDIYIICFNIKNMGVVIMKSKLLLTLGLGVMLIFSENDINIKAAVRYNQDVTAYSGTNRTASGKVPEVGYAAVHWVGSNQQNPIIPFGTYIYIDSVTAGTVTNDTCVPTPQGEVCVWRVEDTGKGTGLSEYWLDLYFGNDYAAKQFGKGKITYRY